MAVKTPIYMDYQATTPLDERVFAAMEPYWRERFGNPHSVSHRYGWEAEAGLETAREQVAGLVGADPKGLIFTSGATESNNLAIKGVMEAFLARKPHLVTVATEHKCVLECAKVVERWGGRVTYLEVDEQGLIDLEALEAAIGEETALVSVMAVNNEIGVIQPITEIGRICRAAGAYFHCDAAQAFGKIALDVEAMGIDLLSVSAHKIYGPKGVGGLWMRRTRPRVRMRPQMSGGGQEAGIRSGTLAPPLCVGLGEAARIAGHEMAGEAERLSALMTRFRGRVLAAHPGVIVNGDADRRWQGNLNLSFPGLDGERLLAELRDLAVSSGAACASASSGPSYVLDALGQPRAIAQSAIRFGIGRFTSEAEIDYAAERVVEAVDRLGGVKPAEAVA